MILKHSESNGYFLYKTKGKLFLDKGAIEALNNHKSLLPAGVIKAIGNFERGDVVEIISENNEKVGQVYLVIHIAKLKK